MNQPAPTPNTHEPTWERVIRDLGSYANPDLITRIRERDTVGLHRYGVRLQPHNGRDSILDAFEEALDLLVYTKNAIVEAVGTPKAGRLMGVYVAARDAVIRLHAIVEADAAEGAWSGPLLPPARRPIPYP